DRGDAAVDAQRDALRARFEVAARGHQVLLLQRLHDVHGGDAGGTEGEGIHADVDLSLASADDRDLADAEDGFELATDLLVRDLGQIAQALALAAHAEVE